MANPLHRGGLPLLHCERCRCLFWEQDKSGEGSVGREGQRFAVSRQCGWVVHCQSALSMSLTMWDTPLATVSQEVSGEPRSLVSNFTIKAHSHIGGERGRRSSHLA